MSFSEQEIEEFKSEALELLELAEKSLLSLDHAPSFEKIFDTVFRSFHNLKGGAGIMDLGALQAHVHELETILMRFKGASGMPEKYVSFFLLGIDAARIILEGKAVDFDYAISADLDQRVAAGEKPQPEAAVFPVPAAVSVREPEPIQAEVPVAAMDEFVSECGEILERVEAALREVEAGSFGKETVEGLYRDIHSLKGAAFLFSFNVLGEVAHAMESCLEPVRSGERKPDKGLLNALYAAVEVAELLAKEVKTKGRNAAVEARIPQLLVDLGSAPKGEEMDRADKAEKDELDKSPAATAEKEKESEGSGSIRVPVALLDNLMTLMGEMVLVRNQVLQYSSASEDLEFLNLSKRLNVVTSEIQGEMMKTRMQPIGNILNKFNRVVRDLSQELGKDIVLALSGAETELDKSLLEAIKDPLTHIVRNSCDHGLEGPEERKKSGKSEMGTIVIRSYHEGGQVIIEVQDDGRGLNREAILSKAVEKGLTNQGQAAKLSDKEVFQFIFAPGFSTAAKITNVSGRGVGMDVVRSNIERIGGTVDLSSVLGGGTTIKIKIPLTLAIVPALIVKCAENLFAIPQVKLEELVRVEQETAENKVQVLHGAPVYRLRGDILPLVDLRQVLGQQKAPDYSRGTVNIAVLNAEHCSFGLIIDEVQDTADIVVKPLNRLLKSLMVYSGGTILGNGSVALILDVMGIAKVARVLQERSAASEAQKEDQKNARGGEQQDYLLVNVNSPTKHAIVLGYVHRLEEFKRKNVEFSGAIPVIRYRDVILPLVSVSGQLEYGKKDEFPEDLQVVVIERAGNLFGLVVEGIHDTLSTDVPLNISLVKQPGIFGSLNTDQELVVVIDPFEVISRAFPEKTETAGPVSGRGAGALGSLPDLPPMRARPQMIDMGGRILLAEDTSFFRKAIRTVLDKSGFEVVAVNDGLEALEKLERGEAFDLVISDIEMPRLNGFELARKIRSNQKLSGLPLLAVSSRADQKYMQEGVKAGFDQYLEKLKPSLLISVVEELILSRKKAA